MSRAARKSPSRDLQKRFAALADVSVVFPAHDPGTWTTMARMQAHFPQAEKEL
ncbi:hypothetical protein LLG95_04685 [bacterium]|nr:hypothetical protein [bacterium]